MEWVDGCKKGERCASKGAMKAVSLSSQIYLKPPPGNKTAERTARTAQQGDTAQVKASSLNTQREDKSL